MFQKCVSQARSLKSKTAATTVGGPKTFWEDQRAWRPKNLAAQRDEGTKVLRRQTNGGTKKYFDRIQRVSNPDLKIKDRGDHGGRTKDILGGSKSLETKKLGSSKG